MLTSSGDKSNCGGSDNKFVCLICCGKIENFSKPPTKIFAKVLANRFRVFCRYVKLDCKLPTDKFDFLTEPFPFCKSCRPLVLRLFKYYQELRLAKRRISKLSCKVTARMLESRDRVTFQSSSCPDTVENDIQLIENQENCENPLGKISKLRESIFSRYNAVVSLEKLEPRTKLENLMSNRNEDGDCNDKEQNLMEDSLFEMIRLKDDQTETWSPFSTMNDDETISSSSSKDEEDKDNEVITQSKRLRESRPKKGHSTKDQTVEIDANKFLYKNEFVFEKVCSQFKCCSCDFFCNSRPSMISHIKRKHQSCSVFVCETCGKNFAQKQFLKSHQETHSDVRSHLCHQCGQSFKTRPTLVKHIVRHREMDRNVKRFQCEECGQKFTQNKSLKLHKAIHSNILAFECGECLKKFRQHAHLLRHQNTHVGAKPYACDQCGVRFTMKQSVLRHIQSVHNKIPRKSLSKIRSQNEPLTEESVSTKDNGQTNVGMTSNMWTTNWNITQPTIIDHAVSTDLIIQSFRSEVPTTTLVYIAP